MKTNSHLLIKNGQIVNEGKSFCADILIVNYRIHQIASNISPKQDTKIIDATGLVVLPGIIDDQVHFREPGLTHKATIETESKAAVAGGITTFIEMPNTNPQTTTIEKLEQKFDVAAATSWANYSFMFGGTNDNLDEVMRLDPKKVAGLKLFLGSSTGNMLVDDLEVLEKIFSNTNLVISAHCEDETTIKDNLDSHLKTYGEDIPMRCHPEIRSAEACYISSSRAIALAKKTGARLHVFHLSTAKEMALFRNDIPLEQKKITAEVCIHHLWFSDEDYQDKGSSIKWNPAVKSAKDREALWEALLDDRIDVIATDHAPHTWEEKNQTYTKAPSGGPMVQHALPLMLECVRMGKIDLPKVVQKMCHNPAILFDIKDRGFVREGYFADLVLVNSHDPIQVKKEQLLYKCGWSPFEGLTLHSQVKYTILNGQLVYTNGQVNDLRAGQRLTFNR